MVGLGQIERALGFAGNIAGAFPQALDKVDIDAAMDEYFARAGVPPKITRSDKAVAAMRQQRDQQARMQQAAASLPALLDGADAARLPAEPDVNGHRILEGLDG